MSSSSMVAMDAPMSSSLGAMGPLLRKLDLLLNLQYRLANPLKVGIKLLKDDLEEIGAALVEQSMVDPPKKMAKYWMDEVRELSYEIEDYIDNLMLRRTGAGTKTRSVHGHRVRRLKISRLPKTVKPCTRVSKIIRFRTLVREASQRHERYELDGCTAISTYPFTHQRWVPAPRHGLAASCLVGIHDSKMKLTKLLTNEAEHHLKVVPIVGPAGVGKTTLAKELYHDLGRHFECRAFVRVSRKPDMFKVLRSLLSQVQRHQQHCDPCTVQNLVDSLREHLQDKRYFIVIDDLWEISEWDIVHNAFPEGSNGSRIIGTVEIMDVALECCGYHLDDILRMGPLGNQDSGKLLFNRVLGSEHQGPDELREVSYGIIGICGGLPLTIISVASILSRQPNNSELWKQVQTYLCSIWNNNPTLEEMQKEILNLTYISLPHHLKTCLLYLSVYPEGYTIWKVDLVRLWISEGFISATGGKDIEEVAESYFYELVNMGMIQPMQINSNDEVLSCAVHHIVLDLITQKTKQEKFITAIGFYQTITPTKAYRLSLHFSKSKYVKKLEGITLSQVRSLLFFGLLKCMPSIVEFKVLRVLVLEFWGDHDGCMSFNLSRISQLLQLRYFKISTDIIVELPHEIRGLQYLETLEINARISALPLDIIHLPSLLHLRLRDEKKLPDGIGCIRSLRTLQYFDLSSNSEDNVLSLCKLTNLQDLHIICSAAPSDEHLKKNLIALACSLEKLGNLKSFTLAPGTSCTDILFDGSNVASFPPVFLQRLELLPPICVFSRLPEWIGHLHKLCNLKVVVRELLTKDIDMLTELPSLTVLSLYVRRPTAESIIFNRAAFPVLKCFKFWCGVLCLAFQEEALPNLQMLKVGFNAHRGEQFNHVLVGVEHLSNLQVIDGRIGAAVGSLESDRRAAESALKNSISNHLSSPRYSIQMVDRVDEEIPHFTDPPASSSDTLMPDSEVCASMLTNPKKRKVDTAYCQYPGCVKRARGPSRHCIAHGGGRRCQKPGCVKAAEWRTAFCKGHRQVTRCQFPGCRNSAEGLTDYCMGHGGGRLCIQEGCSRAGRGKSGLCIRHGSVERSKLLNLQENDGQIGAAAGAEESEKSSTESVLKDTISKQPRLLSFNMQLVGCVDKEISEASSSLTLISDKGACTSECSDPRKAKVNPEQCQFPRCEKRARGSSMHCGAHGGGRRCQKPGCQKGSQGRTAFCKAHGGGRRCEHIKCTKSAEGHTDYCVDHGGGTRCQKPGCQKGSEGKTAFCKAHGGGRRCEHTGCVKCAVGRTDYCIGHGGGTQCRKPGCQKGSEGKTAFCKAHGGGRRCEHIGCIKLAVGRTDYCVDHGGGTRCQKPGCQKGSEGKTAFCKAHGGGHRCSHEGCSRAARGISGLCIRHGGGKRCKVENCTEDVHGSTMYCTPHGGGKHSWGSVGSGFGIDEQESTKPGSHSTGLSATHNAAHDTIRRPGSGQFFRLMHQFDVEPDETDFAVPKGDPNTKTSVDDTARVGGENLGTSSSTSIITSPNSPTIDQSLSGEP